MPESDHGLIGLLLFRSFGSILAMPRNQIKIVRIEKETINTLRPLVDQFIETHKSLSFRKDYWSSFSDWLKNSEIAENILSLRATIDNDAVGFVIGIIQDNGPLISPERVGYVSIIVVDRNHYNAGIGNALWIELKRWFVSNDIRHFELYTEFGNSLSGSFWSNRGFDTFLERRRLCSEK
jgi:ribosomal protein S18 acetylase RimI-like enzyme